MSKSDSLIVITAPSGAGKSTIISQIIQRNSDYCFSVSHTTRPIRGSEQNGKEYYFVSVDVFKEMISQNNFLEWAEVHSNYYGTSKKEIDRLVSLGKRVILDIDVQGALALKEKGVEALYVFIKVDSQDELRKRLMNRGTDSLDVIENRVKNSIKEMEFAKKWKHVIINADLEQAVVDLESILG